MNKIDLTHALKDSDNLSRPETEKIVTLFSDQNFDPLSYSGSHFQQGIFADRSPAPILPNRQKQSGM